MDENDSEPLMHDCEVLAKACFYGSLHGFQVLVCGGVWLIPILTDFW